MSIYDFKKGDIITRIEPSKPIPGLEIEEVRDRGYIGSPLKFLGVANGCVYVERYEKNKGDYDDMPEIGKFFKVMLGKGIGPINLPLDMWDQGWTYYIDPYDIESYDIGKKLDERFQDPLDNEMNISKKDLENQLKSALSKEDYELADKIKKKLKNFK